MIQGLFLFLFGGFIVFYHLVFSVTSRNHRKFPHTAWFGLISALIVLFIFSSWILFVVAILSFTSHLILDYHLKKSFELF